MHDPKGSEYCKQCKLVATKTKKELDCNACPNNCPVLPTGLVEVYKCFSVCSSQLRVGFGGAYALDYNVAIRVADDFGIVTNQAFYTLLQVYENTLISEMSKKSDTPNKTIQKQGNK